MAVTPRQTADSTALLRRLDSKVGSLKSEMVEFTKKLVKIRTENPPGKNYGELVSAIKKLADASGFETKIYGKSGKPNLVITWNVGSKHTLHINGHYDVVPAVGAWKHAPFEPVIEDGKLFGRGAADSKSNICAVIYAAKAMKELGMKPACNLELSFTCDEESGGVDGLGYLVAEKLVKPDFAIVADGPVRGINNAHKGVLALKITVVGKSAHAAWPQRGVNAFLGAGKLAIELNGLNTKLGKVKSRCDTSEEVEKSPTIVPGGRAEGGVKFNSVPGEFSFTIDRRIIPEEKISDAKDELLAAINAFSRKNPEYGVIIETILEAKPSFADKNCKISKALSRSIKSVKGEAPNYYLLPGFLDMRYLVNEAKIDCVNYGTAGGNEHGVDEFVYADSILDLVKIFVLTAMDKELEA